MKKGYLLNNGIFVILCILLIICAILKFKNADRYSIIIPFTNIKLPGIELFLFLLVLIILLIDGIIQMKKSEEISRKAFQ